MASSVHNLEVRQSSGSSTSPQKQEQQFTKTPKSLRALIGRIGRILVGHALLVLVLTAYLCLGAIFLWRAFHGMDTTIWRILFACAGVALILVIPEITHNQSRLVRIISLFIPLLGAAILQEMVNERIWNGDNVEGRKVYAATLNTIVMGHEIERTERQILEPTASVVNGETIYTAYILKANRLDISASYQEAALLRDYPELIPSILKIPDNPRAKLAAFEQLDRTSPHFRNAIKPVTETLKMEVAYLDVADVFRAKIAPAYKQLEYQIEHQALLSTEVCEQIYQIIEPLQKIADAHAVAGLLNHLGNMRLNCGRPNDALADFYRALTMDANHIPIYESLGYGIWNINNDSRTALEFTTTGIRLANSERNAPQLEYLGAVKIYNEISNENHDFSGLISHRVKTLEHRVGMIQSDWGVFIDGMVRRMKNDFAYYSALRLENKEEALAYISEIYKETSDVAEIQDTYAFVLMRFATDMKDLDKAGKLLNAAARNPRAEPETKRLVAIHLYELDDYKLGFMGRYDLSQLKPLENASATAVQAQGN